MSTITDRKWERLMVAVEDLRDYADSFGFRVTNHPDHIDDPYAFVARRCTEADAGTVEIFVHIEVTNTHPELNVRKVTTGDLYHTKLAAEAVIEGLL